MVRAEAVAATGSVVSDVTSGALALLALVWSAPAEFTVGDCG